MVDATMTPPRDGGPPGDEELVARVIPLRRRDEARESTLLAPTSPPATAFNPPDEPAEPTSAVADRDMWEDRASRLRLREPVVAGGQSGSVRLPAAHGRRTTRRRGVSRVAFGIAALVAMVVAVVVISSSGSPRVAGSPAHGVDSKSASSAAKVSAAKTAPAPAAAAQAALRTARTRAAATAARKRASRIARAHKLAVARARATRAKQRARELARQPASEGSTTSTAAPPATPAVTEPPVAISPPVVTHPKSSAPTRGSGSAGGCATAVPGQLGC
jgi:hypothetical protein